MFVRDELKALRGDNREARTHRVAMEEALEDCRREPRLAAVLEELLRYGEGGDFAHCPALVALFEHTRAARALAAICNTCAPACERWRKANCASG